MKRVLFICASLFMLLACGMKEESHYQMKGVVLAVEDLATVDWPKLAHENGINTIGTHINPGQVKAFIDSPEGQRFLEGCEKYGIAVEHQLHAMKELLPRDLFNEDPEMFRMNEAGERTPDFNCCVHSEKALEIIAQKAAEFAVALPATNHRYYYWLDDGAPTCQCEKCLQYTASEQALIIENSMIGAIRQVDPEAKLAHLSYFNTMDAPRKVKPAEGIFLEFAPFLRVWDKPLTDGEAHGPRTGEMTHADNMKYLKDNLEVFPVEDAVILEYWLDVSLFSGWKKPAVELPWNKEVFESDIDTYAKLGIRNVTTFAVYMDSAYFAAYPDPVYLKEYGEGLGSYRME